MNFRTIGLGLAACLAAAPASAMSVADFLTKADALKTMGMMAVFSPDYSLLKTEVRAGIKTWKAQIAAPGRPPNACPPADMPEMTASEVLSLMNAIPPAQRAATETADAVIAGLNRRFPCHA